MSHPQARWLWITPELTTSPSTGALVYSHSLIDAVAGLGQHVTAVGLGRQSASELNATSGADVTWIPVADTTRSAVRTLLSPLPHAAAKTATRMLSERVRELLDEPWDVVVIDGLQSAWATRLLSSLPSGPTTVYVAHNHETSMRSEIAAAEHSFVRRAVLRYDVRRTARLESMTVNSCDVVSTITDLDRERFEAEAADTSFVVVAPGWSGVPRSTWPAMPTRPRRAGILGSFEWHVKQEGLRRFLTVADPAFASSGCELVIGGRVPEGFRHSIEPQLRSTRFVGWVDSPGAFLDSCRVGVISESLGGGFKLKSLDYIFNHVPLACLTHCAAGLPLVDGESMLAADDEAGLVARILESIDDGPALERMAERAHHACGAVFGWPTAAARLVAAIDQRR